MSKVSDIAGVISNFSIGLLSGSGSRVLSFLANGFTGSLSWTLTANRTVTIPDKTGTLLLEQDKMTLGVSVTANKTFTLSDANTYQNCTNTSVINLVIPNDTTTNFPDWTEIEIAANGTGDIIFVADSGVVIRRGGSTETTLHTIIGQYYAVVIKKIATNTWIIYGDLR